MDYIFLSIIILLSALSILGTCLFLCRYNICLALCVSNCLHTYFLFSRETNTSHLDLSVCNDTRATDLESGHNQLDLSLSTGGELVLPIHTTDQAAEQLAESIVSKVPGYPLTVHRKLHGSSA